MTLRIRCSFSGTTAGAGDSGGSAAAVVPGSTSALSWAEAIDAVFIQNTIVVVTKSRVRGVIRFFDGGFPSPVTEVALRGHSTRRLTVRVSTPAECHAIFGV